MLLVLGLGSIFSGYLLSDLIIGNGTDFLIFNYLNIHFYNLDFHLGNLNINLLALYYTLIGSLFSYLLFSDYMTNFYLIILNSIILEKNSNKNFFKFLLEFFSNRWYINFFYNRIIAKTLLSTAYNKLFLIMDQGYINNGLGPLFIIKIIRKYLNIVLI